jgi:hypothetical protein
VVPLLRKRGVCALAAAMLAAAGVLAAGPARGQAPAPAGAVKGAAVLDRVVVRWYAPETGGVARPQLIFERELAFEARVEALSSPDPEPSAYNARHVRAALDRHIAETLLSSLPIIPTPTPKEIASRAELARGVLEQRVRGRAQLIAAASAESVGSAELDALLRRQALASLYLDRMVAPMLEPSELDLRTLLRTQDTPFKGQPFDLIAPALRRWFIGQRLNQALDAYYQNARSRVTIVLVRRR